MAEEDEEGVSKNTTKALKRRKRIENRMLPNFVSFYWVARNNTLVGGRSDGRRFKSADGEKEEEENLEKFMKTSQSGS